MSNLINQLKTEHQQISIMLTEVNNLGISTAEGLQKLSSVKSLLMKHLQKENEELYPVLNIESKKNKMLKNNLQVLSLEMKGVVEHIAKFFLKHEKGNAVLEFNLDFTQIFTMLLQRFVKEEKVLYNEYLHLKKSAGHVL